MSVTDEFVWVDEPPTPQTGGKYVPHLKAMEENPDRWLQIVTLASRTGASSYPLQWRAQANNPKSRYSQFNFDFFQFETRVVDGRHTLYGKYIGKKKK